MDEVSLILGAIATANLGVIVYCLINIVLAIRRRRKKKGDQ